jgi:uncharacterized protein GlcG (DUF336 family)
VARETVTLEEAERIIEAAQEKAREIGQPMNIAVVDNGRDLKAFARMEDAWLGSIDIAINKAFTSASFLMPTQDLAEMTQPGQPLYGLETTNFGRVVNFAGGIPLMRGEEVAGAIGVSGGTVDQDQEVAEAGVAAF